MPVKAFHQLYSIVPCDEFYFADTNVLVNAMVTQKSSNNNNIAKRVLRSLLAGSFVVASELVRNELYPAVRNAYIEYYKDQHPECKTDKYKEILRKEPRLRACINNTVQDICDSLEENPRFAWVPVNLCPEDQTLAHSTSVALNMEPNDVMHLMFMKDNGITNLVTMDGDFLNVNDPYFNIYVPDYAFNNYKGTNGQTIVIPESSVAVLGNHSENSVSST